MVSIAENSYRTDLLQRMAESMKISKQLQTLKDGKYYKYLMYNNRPITIIVEKAEVSHIGYSIFTPFQRSIIKYPVCNFIERYSLEIALPLKREKSVARQLDEDGIFFRNNSFDFFIHLHNDTTYSISVKCLNNKRYTVSWSKNGKEYFAVNFPIEHDLLSGTDMQENERRIVTSIIGSSKTVQNMELQDSALLKMNWQKNYYTLPGDYFYTKQLNSNRYFTKNKSGIFQLFFHPDFVSESLANLMTTGAVENDYDIEIRLVKYGFSQDTILVKLNQWLNFCIHEKCTPYFGILSLDKYIADCEVIMQNIALGYIHVMRLSFDIRTLNERKGVIKARLNSYIPTPRIQYLFDELKK